MEGAIERSIVDALARPATIVAAWDIEAHDHLQTLTVFAVDGIPRVLAQEATDRAGRDAWTAELGARGLVLGEYHLGTGVLWRATPERFCVWSPSGLALDADRERIVVGHATLDAHAVYTAAAFAVADRARRGVSLVRGDHEWIVVETFARESTLGHGYQADATMSAAVWTRALKRALSVWLGRRRGSYDDE